LVSSAGFSPTEVNVLILGQTFKGDVADFRNSQAIRLTNVMAGSFRSVTTFDPYADIDGSNSNPFAENVKYGAVVIAVPHSQFIESIESVGDIAVSGGVIVDLTGKIESSQFVDADVRFWKL
jgi:UDP-N-acetyl-D-mannosaminuronate dehydrogenase